MSKCKYYIRNFPDSVVTSCGNEALDEWYTYCTFCGKRIKETHKDVPDEVLEELWDYE